MLSRVADSIYWMNRYVERAENVARFVEVNLNLLLDTSVAGMTEQWEPLVTTTGDRDRFKARYGDASAHNVLKFLTFDSEYSNSILSCVKSARGECAGGARDHFVRDVGAGQFLLSLGERGGQHGNLRRTALQLLPPRSKRLVTYLLG